MLTPEEFTQAQAALSAAATEQAALDQQRRDYIAKARELNDQTRACTNRITAIDQATASVKAQVAEYIAEQKRKQAEALKAKRAAEEAAKVQEESELAKAQAEVAALKEQLAAKG
jgi:chromosome segregation ATPase